ncbi:hypothetical protein ABL840_15710 [Variovorax sp. NFACC27]|uniref:hypothetical protein n=1 Tax=Variovorax sp. NFACC27 TaxID=1566274 RepID=UPI003AB0748E
MADAPDRDALWSRWEACKLQLGPEYQAQINFVDAALRALPEILRGRRAATEVLFPNGSMELVEGIYRDNEVSDYFNEVLAESLVAAVKARLAQDPQAKLRLFEIGAGTGGRAHCCSIGWRPMPRTSRSTATRTCRRRSCCMRSSSTGRRRRT